MHRFPTSRARGGAPARPWLGRAGYGAPGRRARFSAPWGRPARPEASRDDAGMATAEYAIATLAACGFAGLLLVIMRSDEVRGLLMGLIQRALSGV